MVPQSLSRETSAYQGLLLQLFPLKNLWLNNVIQVIHMTLIW